MCTGHSLTEETISRYADERDDLGVSVILLKSDIRAKEKKQREQMENRESHDVYFSPLLKSDTESPCPIHYRGMKFKVRNLA